jgi:hypothetical protein
MFHRISFKRGFSVKAKNDSVKLVVPVVRNYILLALLYLVSYFWFTKSFRFLYSFLPEAIETFDTLIAIILGSWLIFSFLLVKWLVWYIYGAETITVKRDLLIIQTRGKLFSKKRVFEVKEINWIKLDTLDNRLANEIQTDDEGQLIEEGRIRFKYKHQLDDIGFGEGLSVKEAIEFLDLLALKGIISERLWVYKKTSEGEYYG